MGRAVVSHRRTLATVIGMSLTLAVLALLLSGSHALADSQCKNITGKAYPIIAELDGDLDTVEFLAETTGSLKGRFEATEFVTFPTGRPEVPQVVFFNEVLTFFTDSGDVIKTIGQGAFDPTTGRWAEVLSTIEVNGQTGDFSQMYMTGVFNTDRQRFEADYYGELCPK